MGTPHKRRFSDRLQDRIWVEWSARRAIRIQDVNTHHHPAESISASLGWPPACAALARGDITSKNFRRLQAVMEVVETLGPCEGRHHAGLIRSSGMARWFKDERLRQVASWGDPLTWPGFLLGTPNSFAPSTLRYLSHAIRLADCGSLTPRGRIVEIGVGYGGLAAINALVSEATTLLVDLPDVERAAMIMLGETGLDGAAKASADDDDNPFDCFVSNYAFTELSRDLQEQFIATYAARSVHGMIISNANVFAAEIGGMDNNSLVSTLRSHGIDATISTSDDLLSPTDRDLGAALITW